MAKDTRIALPTHIAERFDAFVATSRFSRKTLIELIFTKYMDDNNAPTNTPPTPPPPPVKKVPLWESERAKRPDLWDKPWECEAYYESPEERKAREKEYFEKELWRRQIISPDPVPPYEAGALERAVDELGTYEP